MKPSVNIKLRLLVIFITGFLWSGRLCGQVENFTNFTVENGLGQSQVYALAQDNYGMLWAGTLGGISRFDSREFVNIDKSDGLVSTLVFAVHADRENNIWVGTQEGLQVYRGRKFKVIRLPDHVPQKQVSMIRQDKLGDIYVLCGQRQILKVSGDKAEDIPVTRETGEIVTCIETDRSGMLYAVLANRSVYRLRNDKWEFLFSRPVNDQAASNYILFFDSADQPWFIGNKIIYRYGGEGLKVMATVNGKNAFPAAVEEDRDGNIWVGTSSGVYLIRKDFTIQHYGAANGLTNNGVHDILRDAGDNMWFATDAEGIYRLTGNTFIYYNRDSDLKSNLVMGIARDGNAMWVGTADNGLIKFEDGRIAHYNMPSAKPEAQKINCLYTDSQGRLWVGTIGGGIWVRAGKGSPVFRKADDNKDLTVISFFEDSRGIIWIGSPQGLFYSDGNVVKQLHALKNVPFSFLEAGKDTIIVGTSSGLNLITGHSEFVIQPVKELRNKTIVCLRKSGNYLIAGTNDEGIFFWDRATGRITSCSRAEGLTSNTIFSIFLTGKNEILTGTGNGIHQVGFSDNASHFTVKKFAAMNSAFGPECNMNAIEQGADGKLWIGTIRGLLVYDPGKKPLKRTAPFIFLKSVKLFSKEIDVPDTVVAWYHLPRELKLKPLSNHLTFDFSAVYMTNPQEIQYRYMLEGADTGFSEMTANPQVIYSNLSPGSYKFRAIAYTNDGTRSSSEVQFPFVIRAHFYQETWFKILAVLSLIGTGVIIQYARARVRQRRNLSIKNIRKEEQRKIQERTAEDLHDDLGNKITRITVLADVLQNKIGEEDPEKGRLVKQIRENAQALYLGTKDIIWSMTPGNDSLYDLFERIRLFGEYMFEDTVVDFKISGLNNGFREVPLPVDISRNIMMVVKESLNNILKHAEAGKAGINVFFSQGNLLTVDISDDGRGFDNALLQNGNGLRNIQKRISRIGGEVSITSDMPGGTRLHIALKIPPKEG